MADEGGLAGGGASKGLLCCDCRCLLSLFAFKREGSGVAGGRSPFVEAGADWTWMRLGCLLNWSSSSRSSSPSSSVRLRGNEEGGTASPA